MSTIIIITPPKKPTAAELSPGSIAPQEPYSEARAAIDAAEAEGTDVRIIET